MFRSRTEKKHHSVPWNSLESVYICISRVSPDISISMNLPITIIPVPFSLAPVASLSASLVTLALLLMTTMQCLGAPTRAVVFSRLFV